MIEHKLNQHDLYQFNLGDFAGTAEQKIDFSNTTPTAIFYQKQALKTIVPLHRWSDLYIIVCHFIYQKKTSVLSRLAALARDGQYAGLGQLIQTADCAPDGFVRVPDTPLSINVAYENGQLIHFLCSIIRLTGLENADFDIQYRRLQVLNIQSLVDALDDLDDEFLTGNLHSDDAPAELNPVWNSEKIHRSPAVDASPGADDDQNQVLSAADRQAEKDTRRDAAPVVHCVQIKTRERRIENGFIPTMSEFAHLEPSVVFCGSLGNFAVSSWEGVCCRFYSLLCGKYPKILDRHVSYRGNIRLRENGIAHMFRNIPQTDYCIKIPREAYEIPGILSELFDIATVCGIAVSIKCFEKYEVVSGESPSEDREYAQNDESDVEKADERLIDDSDAADEPVSSDPASSGGEHDELVPIHDAKDKYSADHDDEIDAAAADTAGRQIDTADLCVISSADIPDSGSFAWLVPTAVVNLASQTEDHTDTWIDVFQNICLAIHSKNWKFFRNFYDAKTYICHKNHISERKEPFSPIGKTDYCIQIPQNEAEICEIIEFLFSCAEDNNCHFTIQCSVDKVAYAGAHALVSASPDSQIDADEADDADEDAEEDEADDADEDADDDEADDADEDDDEDADDEDDEYEEDDDEEDDDEEDDDEEDDDEEDDDEDDEYEEDDDEEDDDEEDNDEEDDDEEDNDEEDDDEEDDDEEDDDEEDADDEDDDEDDEYEDADDEEDEYEEDDDEEADDADEDADDEDESCRVIRFDALDDDLQLDDTVPVKIILDDEKYPVTSWKNALFTMIELLESKNNHFLSSYYKAKKNSYIQPLHNVEKFSEHYEPIADSDYWVRIPDKNEAIIREISELLEQSCFDDQFLHILYQSKNVDDDENGNHDWKAILRDILSRQSGLTSREFAIACGIDVTDERAYATFRSRICSLSNRCTRRMESSAKPFLIYDDGKWYLADDVIGDPDSTGYSDAEENQSVMKDNYNIQADLSNMRVLNSDTIIGRIASVVKQSPGLLTREVALKGNFDVYNKHEYAGMRACLYNSSNKPYSPLRNNPIFIEKNERWYLNDNVVIKDSRNHDVIAEEQAENTPDKEFINRFDDADHFICVSFDNTPDRNCITGQEPAAIYYQNCKMCDVSSWKDVSEEICSFIAERDFGFFEDIQVQRLSYIGKKSRAAFYRSPKLIRNSDACIETHCSAFDACAHLVNLLKMSRIDGRDVELVICCKDFDRIPDDVYRKYAFDPENDTEDSDGYADDSDGYADDSDEYADDSDEYAYDSDEYADDSDDDDEDSDEYADDSDDDDEDLNEYTDDSDDEDLDGYTDDSDDDDNESDDDEDESDDDESDDDEEESDADESDDEDTADAENVGDTIDFAEQKTLEAICTYSKKIRNWKSYVASLILTEGPQMPYPMVFRYLDGKFEAGRKEALLDIVNSMDERYPWFNVSVRPDGEFCYQIVDRAACIADFRDEWIKFDELWDNSARISNKSMSFAEPFQFLMLDGVEAGREQLEEWRTWAFNSRRYKSFIDMMLLIEGPQTLAELVSAYQAGIKNDELCIRKTRERFIIFLNQHPGIESCRQSGGEDLYGIADIEAFSKKCSGFIRSKLDDLKAQIEQQHYAGEPEEINDADAADSDGIDVIRIDGMPYSRTDFALLSAYAKKKNNRSIYAVTQILAEGPKTIGELSEDYALGADNKITEERRTRTALDLFLSSCGGVELLRRHDGKQAYHIADLSQFTDACACDISDLAADLLRDDGIEDARFDALCERLNAVTVCPVVSISVGDRELDRSEIHTLMHFFRESGDLETFAVLYILSEGPKPLSELLDRNDAEDQTAMHRIESEFKHRIEKQRWIGEISQNGEVLYDVKFPKLCVRDFEKEWIDACSAIAGVLTEKVHDRRNDAMPDDGIGQNSVVKAEASKVSENRPLYRDVRSICINGMTIDRTQMAQWRKWAYDTRRYKAFFDMQLLLEGEQTAEQFVDAYFIKGQLSAGSLKSSIRHKFDIWFDASSGVLKNTGQDGQKIYVIDDLDAFAEMCGGHFADLPVYLAEEVQKNRNEEEQLKPADSNVRDDAGGKNTRISSIVVNNKVINRAAMERICAHARRNGFWMNFVLMTVLLKKPMTSREMIDAYTDEKLDAAEENRLRASVMDWIQRKKWFAWTVREDGKNCFAVTDLGACLNDRTKSLLDEIEKMNASDSPVDQRRIVRSESGIRIRRSVNSEPERTAAPVPMAKPFDNAEYKDKIETILREHYANGYGYGKRQQIKFSTYYKDKFGESCPIDGDELDTVIESMTFQIKRNGYLIEFVLSDTLKQKIDAWIEEMFDNGAPYIENAAVREHFEDEIGHIFEKDENIYRYLRSSDSSYKCDCAKIYNPAELNDEISEAMSDLVQNNWEPIDLIDIRRQFEYLSDSTFKAVLKNCEGIIRLHDNEETGGVYMHVSNLDLNEDDIESIGQMISNKLKTVDALGYEEIQEILTDDYEVFEQYEIRDIKSIITYLYRDVFSCGKAVTSRNSAKVNTEDLLKIEFSECDIVNMPEIDEFYERYHITDSFTKIMKWFYENYIRMDEMTFRKNYEVHFDVNETDDYLDSQCKSDQVAFKYINCALLPYCGETWNIYLLGSYVYNHSKMFEAMFFSKDPTKNGCLGAIVKKGVFRDFDEVIVSYISSLDEFPNDEEEFAQILKEEGYIYMNNTRVKKLYEAAKKRIKE